MTFPLDYLYKTPPFDHQDEDFRRSRDLPYFAIFNEQGTGKTKIVIDTAAWLYLRGQITGLLVVAPNGVHRNWIINEVPAHLPDYIPRTAAWWAADAKKAEREALDRLFKGITEGLRVLAVNVDAFNTDRGRDLVKRFLRTFRCLWAIDESTVIKNVGAARTKHILKLREQAPYRRVLTGTPLTQGPEDLYAQCEFLSPEIINIPSIFAFRARYIKLLDLTAIRLLGPQAPKHLREQAAQAERIISRTPKARWSQWQERDAMGKPQYQRLEELQAKLAPHSCRRTKAECLDLPPKVFEKRYVELSKEQRRIYTQLRTQLLAELGGREMTAPLAMTRLIRLQQVVGGFFVADQALDPELEDDRLIFDEYPRQTGPRPIDIVCPRVTTTLDILRECAGKIIIWARFRAEIAALVVAIEGEFGRGSCCEYHGGVSNNDRSEVVRAFQQDSEPRFLVGHVQAGGKGLTLHAASTVIYYSNNFSLEDRLQSEDRCHRIGQTSSVTYFDLIAENTLDERVVETLRDKKKLADLVTGDRLKGLGGWI